MIGVYNYTVVLTYLSLLSAGTGIFLSLSDGGHPYLGMFCLLLCGLCDAFDGKVARLKKDRTETEKAFGIQIDSLSDIVAFGVLPATIGAAVLFRSELLEDLIFAKHMTFIGYAVRVLLFAVLLFYILSAMIRLGYFNVTEEERQKTSDGVRKYYIGIPVTMPSLVFPLILVMDYVIPIDLSLLYIAAALFYVFGFVSHIHFPKPGKRGLTILISVGVTELIVLGIVKLLLG